jgi:hypothetical protein
MEARAFGAGRRSSFASSPWDARSVAVVAGAILGAAVFVAARVAGVEMDWYPYPDLAMPAIQPFLVAACLPLVLPAVWGTGR